MPHPAVAVALWAARGRSRSWRRWPRRASTRRRSRRTCASSRSLALSRPRRPRHPTSPSRSRRATRGGRPRPRRRPRGRGAGDRRRQGRAAGRRRMLAFDAVATRIGRGRDASRCRAVEVVVRVQPPTSIAARDARRRRGGRGARHGAARLPPAIARCSPSARRAGLTVVAADRRASLAVDRASAPRTRRRRSRAFPSPGAGLVPGLAVGDTSAVAPELDAAMKESSLSHLTAVSGANCALVVGLAFAAAAAVGARRGGARGRRRRRAGGFVLLVTPEPSVVRAAAMAAIAMLGVLLGRTGAGMAVLSPRRYALLLVADPWLVGVARVRALRRRRRHRSCCSPARSPTGSRGAAARPRPRAVGAARRAARVRAAPGADHARGAAVRRRREPARRARPRPSRRSSGSPPAWPRRCPWLQSGLDRARLAARVVDRRHGDDLQRASGRSGAVARGLAGRRRCSAPSASRSAVVIVVPRSAAARAPRRCAGRRGARSSALVAGVAAAAPRSHPSAGRWTLPARLEHARVRRRPGRCRAAALGGRRRAHRHRARRRSRSRRASTRAGIDRIDLLVLTHFDLDHVGGLDAVVRAGSARCCTARRRRRRTRAVARRRSPAEAPRTLQAHAGLHGHARRLRRGACCGRRRESRAFPSGNDASVVLDVRGGGVPPSAVPRRPLRLAAARARGVRRARRRRTRS